jgi:transposase InsO family protein
MAAHAEEHSITHMCRVLGVGRSGYYAWHNRKPSTRELENRELVQQIRKEHQISRQAYGSPRIHLALVEQGIACGKHRVARLMQIHQIVGKKARKRHPIIPQRRPGALTAPNLLNQDFSANEPDEKWGVDITYIDTAEGWLYLAVVLDLFSRRVVGWAMADHMETSLVGDALQMAFKNRHPKAGLLHHSDQGSQYTSYAYQEELAKHNIQVSMNRVGNCYDNAVVESFFATLKIECADHRFFTRALAKRTVFEYIEVWYNRQRLHSSLGYLSPAEFERVHGH